MSKFTSSDIYESVNKRVLDELSKAIAAIEGGAKWERPWVGGSLPRNLQSGKQYRGINALLLSFASYGDPRWTTASAAFKMGAKFKGEKGDDIRKSTLVTLWKPFKVKDPDAPNGERTARMLRYFLAFNVEQFTWPAGALKPLTTEEPPEGFDPHADAEAVFAEYVEGAAIPVHRGGTQAYYRPSEHSITLPDDETFKSAEGYYGTVFHECAHSTHKVTGRELGTSFGNDAYAREELVAEIAAGLVCAQVGVEPNMENSAAYLKGWMSRIRDDEKLFVKAAGQAQRAADAILGVSFNEPESTVAIPDESKETVNV